MSDITKNQHRNLMPGIWEFYPLYFYQNISPAGFAIVFSTPIMVTVSFYNYDLMVSRRFMNYNNFGRRSCCDYSCGTGCKCQGNYRKQKKILFHDRKIYGFTILTEKVSKGLILFILKVYR